MAASLALQLSADASPASDGGQLCELAAHVHSAHGEVRFERPDGSEIAPPRRAPLCGSGGARLRELHLARGQAIDAETPVADWRGQRGDLHYVADVYAERSAFIRARAGPA